MGSMVVATQLTFLPVRFADPSNDGGNHPHKFNFKLVEYTHKYVYCNHSYIKSIRISAKFRLKM